MVEKHHRILVVTFKASAGVQEDKTVTVHHALIVQCIFVFVHVRSVFEGEITGSVPGTKTGVKFFTLLFSATLIHLNFAGNKERLW